MTLFSTLMAVLGPYAYSAELQILTAEENRPAADRSGIYDTLPIIDLIQEIQRRLGDNNKIQYMPWARAYYIAQHEPNVMIFTMISTSERENLFQWVGPLHLFTARFFAKNGSSLRIDSLDDAKKVKSIGVVRGNFTDIEMTKLGFANLDRVMDSSLLVKKLMSGRNELIIDSIGTVNLMMANNKIDPSQIKIVGQFPSYEAYICFSKNTSINIVNQWQNTIDQMKSDGIFARLYSDRRQN